MTTGLRQDEREVLGHLVATWNAFCKLEDQRDAGAEFAWLIHRLQDLIAARPTYRLLDAESPVVDPVPKPPPDRANPYEPRKDWEDDPTMPIGLEDA